MMYLNLLGFLGEISKTKYENALHDSCISA